jgi:hypothetical protein
MPPERGEETHQDQGIFQPRRARTRAQTGSHSRLGGACETTPGQRAIAPRVMIRERACVLAMRGVIGMSQVEDHRGGGLGVTRHAVVDKSLRQAGEVFAVETMLKTREGGSTGQVVLWGERESLASSLPQGIATQAGRIIGVRRARGHLGEALGEAIPEWMVDIGLMTLGTYGCREAFCEANLAVHATQQEGAKVRRQGPSCAISPHGVTTDRRKTALCWARRA